MQRTQSDIFLPATNLAGHPIVPLQVIDKWKPTFQAFQFVPHCAFPSKWDQRMWSLNLAPAEEGGRTGKSSSAAEREQDVQKWRQVSPGQIQRAGMQDLAASQSQADHFECLLQKRERRSMTDRNRFTFGRWHGLRVWLQFYEAVAENRRIQAVKPPPECLRSRNAIRVLHQRRRHVERTVLDKVSPNSLVARDQAVMTVWQRKNRKKGECRSAEITDPAPNANPIVVFVMSLFAAPSMPNNRLVATVRALPQEVLGAGDRPVFVVVFFQAKWDKDNHLGCGDFALGHRLG
jgi:hypothetical protein